MGRKRKYRNSGYSEGGGSMSKKTLKAWRPAHYSAVSDIDQNLKTLRDRAADLTMNSALGASAIKTQVSGVISEGLKVFPKIDNEALGMSVESARQWCRRVKSEFEFWASSIECDFYKRNNFYEMQKIAYNAELMDGDAFVLMRRRTGGAYSLRIQLIEAQRVSNPESGLVEMKRGDNRIVNGIEVDRNGTMQAIWITNKIWDEYTTTTPTTEWQRVKVRGEKSGARNVLMLSNDTRINQFRGEPYLAPVIEVLKNVDRYTEAELTSGIIRSYFSVFFTQLSSLGTNYGLNEIAPEEEEIDPAEYRLGSGVINALPQGVDVKAINSTGASVFESFLKIFSELTGAALGLPYEVLLKKFQSSYSASKAALLQAENEFRQRRKAFVTDFCAPIYEIFLDEAVALGRITAPGYFTDPKKRYLYRQANWYNQTNNILDVTKEISAAGQRIELGLSTHEKEAAELYGVDFFENIRQQEVERRILSEKILESADITE